MTGRVFILLSFLVLFTYALENGLGRVPAMGYNSWFDLMCSSDMNEKVIMSIMDTFVAKGLNKLGYNYINLDDCWAKGRDSKGNVFPDPVAFPRGMAFLASYAHSKGLKFGLYTDRGPQTCGGRPGSGGYEAADAKTYASWNIDYLKEDSCYASQEHDIAFDQYSLMRDSLADSGRDIYFSLCGWYSWYAPRGSSIGNSWRIGPDNGNWGDVMTNVNVNAQLSTFAGPGGWNDPCLLIGTQSNGQQSLTPIQSRTQFSLWAIMASPLLISQDVRNMTGFQLDTYTNAEVIAVNQDPLGMQGNRIAGLNLTMNSGTNVWGRWLSDGSAALLFVNNNPTPTNVQCDEECFKVMGLKLLQYSARDLWKHQDIGIITAPIIVKQIAQHDSVMLRLTQYRQ